MAYILYYSDKCPDTPAFVEELATQGIEYQAVNITDSMANLKQFLHLRDNRPEFDERKKWGFVGVPVLHMPNNQLIFDLGDLRGVTCNLTPRP